MARTFLRQETQIRQSDAYIDNNAPAATMESTAVSIEDDLNNLRSIASLLRDVQTGNWYDDLVAPVTFELGAKRGVQNVNADLHDLERKRILVEVFNLNDIPIGTQAAGALTTTGATSDGETVTIGAQTYTLKSPFVDAANNIDASGTTAATLDNLKRAINGDGVAGTNYGTGTTVNASAYATSNATVLSLLAKIGGTAGNSVATTETMANASFGAATLTGGVASSTSVLTRTAALPSNTTLAIGAVTTLGTVVAQNGGFPTFSLANVSGSHALSPKNLVPIVDSITHDPILSSSRRVYGLLQSESATDGSTATITTPNRLVISYVRQNSSGLALEAVPSADISGLLVHYSAIERKALEDFDEQDFLRGTTLDVPTSTTVTRQVAYDNQGTTPVELTNNATLDINSAGLAWTIRDLVNADLFKITEGSTGGTSTVLLSSDVDTFDSSAVINDFDQGLRLDTGGQRINIGETAGLIESTGANDLRVLGAGELYLDDGNQTGSTWAQTNGIKLSDTTAEWDAFETNFGEVSLLQAINLAYTTGNEAKTYANVTANVNANLDVSLAAGNLDVALPDMSTGNFLQDYDVYLNGNLLRPGANSGANHDYYPGSTLTPAAALRFEFKLKTNDVICVVKKIA